MGYTVAIIGRPNVGKSTLFNRVTKSKKSITENIPGVTRDRLYEKVEYNEKTFNLIDTGGITLSDGTFDAEIRIQAEIAITESDCIIFVVDAMQGVTTEDQLIASLLRNSKKNVIIAANKVDNIELKNTIYDFYQFGFEFIIPISSIHGNGIYDILEIIEPNIQESNEVTDEEVINFCLIGRPNVGKSSLFNALTNENRAIVSDVEGTTRDAIDYEFTKDEQRYKIIDTAGIKKRGKILEKVEKYSVLRSLKAVEKSDIVLWLIDAEKGIQEQDKKVLGYALEENKPIIIIVNKWDLVKKETNTQKLFETKLKAEMPFILDRSIVFLSALTSKGVKNVLPELKSLFEKYSIKLSTSQVNHVLNEAVSSTIHPSHKGKPIKFYYATQVASRPPKFLIFVNNEEIVHFSYKRYLTNYFKRAFGLRGISLILVFRNKKSS